MPGHQYERAAFAGWTWYRTRAMGSLGRAYDNFGLSTHYLAQGTGEEGMPGFKYEPAAFAGWIWNRTRATGSLGRAYNYPHQVSVYHAMYRILTENDLASAQQPALWYLRQAAMTIKVLNSPAGLPVQQSFYADANSWESGCIRALYSARKSCLLECRWLQAAMGLKLLTLQALVCAHSHDGQV